MLKRSVTYRFQPASRKRPSTPESPPTGNAISVSGRSRSERGRPEKPAPKVGGSGIRGCDASPLLRERI